MGGGMMVLHVSVLMNLNVSALMNQAWHFKTNTCRVIQNFIWAYSWVGVELHIGTPEASHVHKIMIVTAASLMLAIFKVVQPPQITVSAVSSCHVMCIIQLFNLLLVLTINEKTGPRKQAATSCTKIMQLVWSTIPFNPWKESFANQL